LLRLNPEGRFIHISSSSIYNLGKSSTNITEDDFSMGSYPFYNPYGESKAKAEDALLNGVLGRITPPITLRPHGIYGEDDTTLIPKLRERVKAGTLVLPDGGQVKHSLTNIANLMQAIGLGLLYMPSKPEAFNVTDATPVTIAEAAASVLGNIKIKGIPTKVLLNPVAKMLGVSQYEVRQLGMERTYDLTKARTVLGYDPSGFEIDWK
jgi:nucleoside-diphosphate-sugar epimerase